MVHLVSLFGEDEETDQTDQHDRGDDTQSGFTP